VLITAASSDPQPSVELETHDLPGLVIDLPRGTQQDRPSSYAQGQRTVRAAAFSAVNAVAWRPGRFLDDQSFEYGLQATLRALAAASETVTSEKVTKNIEVPLPKGLEGRSWKLEMPDREFWSTEMACGGRHVSIVTMSNAALAPKLHRKVVASVRCRPQAAMEATLLDIPVVLDLPSGWTQTQTKSKLAFGTLGLTDGVHFIAVNPVLSRLSAQQSLGVLKASKGFVQDVRLTSEDHDAITFEGTFEGRPMAGSMTYLECPELGRTLQLMSWSQERTPEPGAGLKLLRKARCRRANEQPQNWPPSAKAESR